MTETSATRFDPGQFEEKWYDAWIERGHFNASRSSDKPTFSIVIPPPNVTGKLHMGHALVNTLQDVIVRMRRMQGFNTLWLPGTDHAGIATQMVVERALLKEGKTRHDLGREEFLKLMWEWKEKYKDNIKGQLRLLGCSCDWTRERFTLDEGLSKAVRHLFVKLHEEGLLYRDTMIVNWCPRCQTALSDLEVEHVDVKGKLYTIAYPMAEGEGELLVATTRPETLLGDTAVAVHPEDDRYSKFIGKEVKLPLTSRTIPVIADEMVDREFGTGVVKITPSHDPNDFQAARRNDLPTRTVMDERGVMNENAGEYAGKDRFEARRIVLEHLKEQGLLREVKDHLHAVGHCQRCQTMIEPYLSKQWFVRMKPLAEPAIEAVRHGDITFIPENWTKTYYEWLNNIHDWCISRQIWWGHRIPAFDCTSCGWEGVSVEEVTVCPSCGSTTIHQEEDVLDTWFSSGLWPFSTLGWPDETPDLKLFYPTSLLITGFDILFFWVARMIMMGLYCTGEIPFKEVYLNALVRDAKGQKMSKTRGNALEPEEMCGTYGADAVRFTLAILASPGRDIPLDTSRMEGYKAFITKVWNAARFVRMKAPERKPLPSSPKTEIGRWILSIYNRLIQTVTTSLDNYRFDKAAGALYHFLWHEYCDWFIEMAKPSLSDEEADPQERDEINGILYHVLDGSLRLLHPFMPFVTEEIWHTITLEEGDLIVAAFPTTNPEWDDPESEESLDWFKEIVTRIRTFRASCDLPASVALDLQVRRWEKVEPLFPLLAEIANLAHVKSVDEVDTAFVDHCMGNTFGVQIPAESFTQALKEKMAKEIEKMKHDIAGTQKRLKNKEFLEKAPEAVIQKQRDKLTDLTARLNLFTKNLE